jgi:phosphonate transport system substrate-binding protein
MTGVLRAIRQAIVIVAVTAMFALAACGGEESSTPTPVETVARNQTLILSDISDDPAGKIEKYQPLADYLVAQLADFGIKQGKVVVAPDMRTMIEALKTEAVDLYFDSRFPAFTVYNEAGARPFCCGGGKRG